MINVITFNSWNVCICLGLSLRCLLSWLDSLQFFITSFFRTDFQISTAHIKFKRSTKKPNRKYLSSKCKTQAHPPPNAVCWRPAMKIPARCCGGPGDSCTSWRSPTNGCRSSPAWPWRCGRTRCWRWAWRPARKTSGRPGCRPCRPRRGSPQMRRRNSSPWNPRSTTSSSSSTLIRRRLRRKICPSRRECVCIASSFWPNRPRFASFRPRGSSCPRRPSPGVWCPLWTLAAAFRACRAWRADNWDSFWWWNVVAGWVFVALSGKTSSCWGPPRRPPRNSRIRGSTMKSPPFPSLSFFRPKMKTPKLRSSMTATFECSTRFRMNRLKQLFEWRRHLFRPQRKYVCKKMQRHLIRRRKNPGVFPTFVLCRIAAVVAAVV